MRNDKTQIVLESLLKSVSAINSKIDDNEKVFSKLSFELLERDLLIQDKLERLGDQEEVLDRVKEPVLNENKYLKYSLPGAVVLIITMMFLSVFFYVQMNTMEEYYYKYELVKRYKVTPEEVEKDFSTYKKVIITRIDSLDEIELGVTP